MEKIDILENPNYIEQECQIICCACKKVLGSKIGMFPKGMILESHTYCEKCLEEVLKDLDNIN